MPALAGVRYGITFKHRPNGDKLGEQAQPIHSRRRSRETFQPLLPVGHAVDNLLECRPLVIGSHGNDQISRVFRSHQEPRPRQVHLERADLGEALLRHGVLHQAHDPLSHALGVVHFAVQDVLLLIRAVEARQEEVPAVADADLPLSVLRARSGLERDHGRGVPLPFRNDCVPQLGKGTQAAVCPGHASGAAASPLKGEPGVGNGRAPRPSRDPAGREHPAYVRDPWAVLVGVGDVSRVLGHPEIGDVRPVHPGHTGPVEHDFLDAVGRIGLPRPRDGIAGAGHEQDFAVDFRVAVLALPQLSQPLDRPLPRQVVVAVVAGAAAPEREPVVADVAEEPVALGLRPVLLVLVQQIQRVGHPGPVVEAQQAVDGVDERVEQVDSEPDNALVPVERDPSLRDLRRPLAAEGRVERRLEHVRCRPPTRRLRRAVLGVEFFGRMAHEVPVDAAAAEGDEASLALVRAVPRLRRLRPAVAVFIDASAPQAQSSRQSRQPIAFRPFPRAVPGIVTL